MTSPLGVCSRSEAARCWRQLSIAAAEATRLPQTGFADGHVASRVLFPALSSQSHRPHVPRDIQSLFRELAHSMGLPLPAANTPPPQSGGWQGPPLPVSGAPRTNMRSAPCVPHPAMNSTLLLNPGGHLRRHLFLLGDQLALVQAAHTASTCTARCLRSGGARDHGRCSGRFSMRVVVAFGIACRDASISAIPAWVFLDPWRTFLRIALQVMAAVS